MFVGLILDDWALKYVIEKVFKPMMKEGWNGLKKI